MVGEIAGAFDVAETASPKTGNSGLKLLEAVSNVIGEEGIVPKCGGAGGGIVPKGGGAGSNINTAI